MSHWDFGRPADGQRDAPRPSGPAGAAYPPDPAGTAGDGTWPPPDGAWPAPDGWPAGDGRAAQGARPAREGQPADESWSADESWLPGGGRPAGEGWPADGGWDDDEGAAPYPLTYERDDGFAAADPRAAAPQQAGQPPRAPWEPWPPAPYPGGPGDAETQVMPGGYAGQQARGGRGQRDTETAAGWTAQELGLPGGDPGDWAGAGPRRGGRRWLIPAGIVVAGAAVGAAAVLLTSGHPASQGAGGFAAPTAAPTAAASAPASPAPSGPAAGQLTMTQAQAVLAGYTAANNDANAQRSDTLLATAETGSSYAIDAGLYQAQQAAGAAPYPAFSPAQATYYIPASEPAAGPAGLSSRSPTRSRPTRRR